MKPYRTIDWCALVTYLEEVSSKQEIAKQTGVSIGTINNIKKESSGGSKYNAIINLVLMYLDKTDKDVPIYGEHHEGVN